MGPQTRAAPPIDDDPRTDLGVHATNLDPTGGISMTRSSMGPQTRAAPPIDDDPRTDLGVHATHDV